MSALTFELPPELEAHAPPEASGLERDEVRLLVSYRDDDALVHTRFRRFPEYLSAGDVLVVNTSATINAALRASDFDLHLSQQLQGDRWIVEPRGHVPSVGERVAIADGIVTFIEPYRGPRLWIATIDVPGDIMAYLDRHGSPIRYKYVTRRWPLRYYQTIFAREPGSAEMPSAARGFTTRMVAELEAKGVTVAPIVLHAGVASQEKHEAPYPEYYRVSDATARAVNGARRVIAVGTTAVRAIETVATADGTVAAGEGWTDLVITPERGVRVVDALLTGFHEPRASHLAMLEALAGRSHLGAAYGAALRARYLWHEFGDLHLILPSHVVDHRAIANMVDLAPFRELVERDAQRLSELRERIRSIGA
jgi:S-adenosylmethionine:tRNA ribosyltransferase-isomerase